MKKYSFTLNIDAFHGTFRFPTTPSRMAGQQPSAVPQEAMTSREYAGDREAHRSYIEAVLKDHVRSTAYENVFEQNKHQFKGKIVLEFPCGSAFLSMMAVRAGAARVIAIDESAAVEFARQLVEVNGFADKITLIQGKIENVELPDGIKEVDILVSDWMRDCLYNRAYLSGVIFARNKWLKPDTGLIFPDHITMYVTAAEARAMKESEIDFWSDVHNFDMTPIGQAALKDPSVKEIEASQIVTDAFPIKEINMYTVIRQEINFVTTFELKATRKDFIHGLVIYFVAEFNKCKQRITLSTAPEAPLTHWKQRITLNTAPEAPLTHWKQTLFYLNRDLAIQSGEKIKGSFSVVLHDRRNNRQLEIDISVRFQGETDPEPVNEMNHYVMKRH